jgi:hypothetical protein
MTDETGDRTKPWAGYLLFVKWQAGDPVASGHLETDYLRFAQSEDDARVLTGAMQLNDALAELNKLIGSQETRPWWEVMKDEGDE